jgi:uncharacterized membrane protein
MTVSSGTANYGVTLQDDAAMIDVVGSDAVYTVQITNTGEVVDTFDLAISGNTWVTVLSANDVTLNNGDTGNFEVTVTIPIDASDGDVDTVTITATSQGDPTKSDAVDLTSTAFKYFVYLPYLKTP